MICVMMKHCPDWASWDVAFEMDEVEMVEEEPWDDNDSDSEADVDGGVSEYERYWRVVL